MNRSAEVVEGRELLSCCESWGPHGWGVPIAGTALKSNIHPSNSWYFCCFLLLVVVFLFFFLSFFFCYLQCNLCLFIFPKEH